MFMSLLTCIINYLRSLVLLICVMGGIPLSGFSCSDESELVVLLAFVLFLSVSLGEWWHKRKSVLVRPIKRWKSEMRTKRRINEKPSFFMSMLLSLGNYFLIIVTAPSYSTGIRSGSRLRKSVYKPRTTSS